jgi:hypothetical protein
MWFSTCRKDAPMEPLNRYPDVEAARFEPPDDYDEKLQQGYEALEFWPQDEMYWNDKAVLDMTPSRADVEAANAELEQAQELMGELQRARYEGRDEIGASTLVLNVVGEVVGLEFSANAVRMGNRELAEAIRESWQSAKVLQVEDAERLNRIARAMGGGAR